MNRTIQHNCDRLFKCIIVVLEMSVEGTVDMMSLQEPMKGCRGEVMSHFEYDIRKTNTVRMVI